MLTKEDKKEIGNIFCDAAEKVIMPAVERIVEDKVKKVIQKEVGQIVRKEVKREVRNEFNRYEKIIDKKFDDYKRDDLQNQDELMGELKTIREEHAADAINISGINDRYMDHEKRIVVLEEKTA